MRYINWDVLLFPAGSKVPMQEFKTGCYAVQDSEFLGSDSVAGLTSGTLAFDHVSTPQVPVVACFLANQVDGSPFRVSLHSWERPSTSQMLQSASHHGKSSCFEARVFIDGICVAGMLFLDRGPWPQVIEMSSQVDKEGNRDFLRWPQFHPEMLTQSYWNAGENMGRIKITVTEGYLHAPGALPFTRTKNLVSFSFQHAPQQILESSGIAWPNAGMWYQPSRPTYHPASPIKQTTPIDEIDLHTHSPRRRIDSMASLEERLAQKMPMPSSIYRSMQPPPNSQRSSVPGLHHDGCASEWATVIPMSDPFVESGRRYGQGHFGGRSTESDLPMPDYSRSITPASSRNATNEVPGQMRSSTTVQHKDQILEDLIPIFHSRSDGSSGVAAPANTRVSSAANTPPINTRLSAAAEARAASYANERQRAVSIISKDAPPKARETSDISMKSRFSEDQASAKDVGDIKLPHKPASEVKGRKEGKNSELDVQHQVERKTSRSSIRASGGKENATTTVTTTIVLSDGKRKRASTSSGNRLSSKDEEALGSSPTRRVTKKHSSLGAVDTPSSDADSYDEPERAPLGLLDNML